MESNSTLTCPKCRAAMASYERNGIVIDQCAECRGIFLDRGELERLMDLESGTVRPNQPDPQWSAAAAPDRGWRGQQPSQQAWRSRHDSDDDSDSHRGRGAGGSHGSHKRKSMLREFLDFG